MYAIIFMKSQTNSKKILHKDGAATQHLTAALDLALGYWWNVMLEGNPALDYSLSVWRASWKTVFLCIHTRQHCTLYHFIFLMHATIPRLGNPPSAKLCSRWLLFFECLFTEPKTTYCGRNVRGHESGKKNVRFMHYACQIKLIIQCYNLAMNGVLCLLGRQLTNTSIWENFGFVKQSRLFTTACLRQHIRHVRNTEKIIKLRPIPWPNPLTVEMNLANIILDCQE